MAQYPRGTNKGHYGRLDRWGLPSTWQGTLGRRAKRRSLDVDNAVDLARAGNDTELLNVHPMKTINPDRPRTLSSGYDPITQTLFVRFREGTRNHPTAGWEYHDVPPNVWRNFIRVNSPGRYINSVLNNYPYNPSDGW